MVERIKELISQNGLNASQFLKEVGLPGSAISEWTKGKAKPSLEALIKIANYFGCTLDYLLGRTSERKPDFMGQNAELIGTLISPKGLEEIKKVLIKHINNVGCDKIAEETSLNLKDIKNFLNLSHPYDEIGWENLDKILLALDIKLDDLIAQAATQLGVTVDELLGNQPVTMPSNIIPINPGDLIKLPVYGNVSAGNGVFAEDNIIDYETVESSDVVPGEEYFYLKIQGDSMYPMFMDGDYILVKKQSSIDSGSFAVALVDGSEAKVKKVVYDSNWIELQSVNPMYPPSRFEDADVLRVRILGLVKGMKRKF